MNNGDECVCELHEYTEKDGQGKGHFEEGGKHYNALPKLKEEFKYNFGYNPNRDEIHVDILGITMLIQHEDDFGNKYYKHNGKNGGLPGFYILHHRNDSIKQQLLNIIDELKSARYTGSVSKVIGYKEIFPFEEVNNE